MLWNAVLSGAVGAGSLVAALVFLRYWRDTRDRFFLFFASSFALESLSRFLLGAAERGGEDTPLFYLIRLAAYALILVAIVDKNRRKPPAQGDD
jgi:hypothetical protein